MRVFGPLQTANGPSDGAAALSRLQEHLPPLLSIVAGMVDLIGFFTLGNIFTAHITGNLVLVTASAVHGGPINLAQALAIPVFMAAVAAAWIVAQATNKKGQALARLLLQIQFFVLAGVLVFSVVARPSADPHGLMAGIAAMLAVSAMACQFALLRLALPQVVSTAVMTGNLTNAVLAMMELLFKQQPLDIKDAARLKASLRLLLGFVIGCGVAAVAISVLSDWAWSLPVALAGLAIAVR
jgi:uncharacterized membrane protein YoaK (UPF0700 family)